ncbi:selenocysteine-specific translation elongation factor [Erwinia oleae]|uniref:selenocysteine-specific translation elongation factor n=1 Tax=Erwinia oleae TaxID=796334 RepID=UPI00054DE700|nr:selenocysteine-specific translation elongation factor [Erwinia oleae]
MIIASAGHVDHGKTALLQAITGVNADRLPEEKARGMTIDLGYAYWPQPDGRVIGFIDVPGHEKFLSNMLCGTGGLDHALLAVAADDGVMPQTREHLAILQLSGRPPLTVAITKADRVDATRLEEVNEQIRTLTHLLGWSDIAIFITSATAGTGIEPLAAHLSQLPERDITLDRPFRLAIDRAFTVKGAGVVVTGTALGGQVRVGDRLCLSSSEKRVRVRGLHAQNQPTDWARAGQRIALNISGDIEKSDLSRGDWLLAEKPDAPVDRVIVALEQHQPLKQGQSLHLHHAASHVTGRVSLLDSDLAELILDTPLWLADNDRLILRDINARETLAGARVIQLWPKKRGKRQPDYLAWLHALAEANEEHQTLSLLLQRPMRVSDLAWTRQLTVTALEAAMAALQPVKAGRYLLLPETAIAWQQKVLSTLGAWHQDNGDRPGLGRERLRRVTLPDQPEEVGLTLIDLLTGQGRLSNNRGWLHLPGFMMRFEADEQALWQRAEPLFADEAWWVRDIATSLNAEETLTRRTLRKAAQAGLIVAIVKDRYFSGDRMQQFADLIRSRAAGGESTSAADFRDRLGIGRKLAVQILEFFDRSGFTRRKGNAHLLRDERQFE